MDYDEELQRQLDERQRHEEMQHEYEIQKRLGELEEVADYVVEGIIKRINEFDLPQSDIEYILKSLPTLVLKELGIAMPVEPTDDIPF